jgi:endogenous inhibitor of DNA gyrase (YacG/DUF329 family)
MPTTVNCPTCGRKVTWIASNAYRPFCSERCKQIDLGAWAAEKYTIAGSHPDPEEPESNPGSNERSSLN